MGRAPRSPVAASADAVTGTDTTVRRSRPMLRLQMAVTTRWRDCAIPRQPRASILRVPKHQLEAFLARAGWI